MVVPPLNMCSCDTHDIQPPRDKLLDVLVPQANTPDYHMSEFTPHSSGVIAPEKSTSKIGNHKHF